MVLLVWMKFVLGMSIIFLVLNSGCLDQLNFAASTGNNQSGQSQTNNFLAGNVPEIPFPSNPNDVLPERSGELIVDTQPLQNFAPYMPQTKPGPENVEPPYIKNLEALSGYDFKLIPNYYVLVKDGKKIEHPALRVSSYLPPTRQWIDLDAIKFDERGIPPAIEKTPYIQRFLFWKKIGTITGGSGQSFKRTYTLKKGVSQKDAEEFSKSISASAGFMSFAKFSAELSQTFKKEITISEQKEESLQFQVDSPAENELLSWTLWQLYEGYRIVDENGNTWSDPNYYVELPLIENGLDHYESKITKFNKE